jgi:uncharacterized OsmC-like protein
MSDKAKVREPTEEEKKVMISKMRININVDVDEKKLLQIFDEAWQNTFGLIPVYNTIENQLEFVNEINRLIKRDFK